MARETMSTPFYESAILDFDGWLGQQNEDTRGGIQQILSVTPEGDRETRKQRIASIFAMAEINQLDPADVHAQWDRVRGGYSEEQGGEWLAAKTDDSKFFGLLRDRVTQQRDERHLLEGLDDEKDPKYQEAWQNSLKARAMDAAYTGKSYADALGDWQESNKETLKHLSPGRAVEHASVARETFTQMEQALLKVRPIAEQAFTQISNSREGEGGDAAPFALFRGLTPDEKKLAFRVMADFPGAGGEGGKLRSQALWEAVGRGFENLFVGGSAAGLRSGLLGARFSEGDQVTRKDPVQEIMADMTVDITGDEAAPFGRSIEKMRGRKLSAEEAADWNRKIDETLQDLDTAEQLRKFGQESIDPAKAGGAFFQKFVLPAADSAALMASMMVPGAAAGALKLRAQGYQNDEYLRLRAEGMDAKEADAIAGVTGLAQASLDQLEFGILKGLGSKYLPKVSLSLERFVISGSRAARFSANFSGTLLGETSVELLQDQIVPALVQDIMASDPKFDVHWGEVWRETGKALPETAMGMVLLSGLGGIAQTRAQSKYVEELTGSKAAMRLQGYTMEQIAEIQKAPLEARGDLLAKHLPTEAPTGEAQKTLVSDVVKLAREEQQAFKAKQQAETVATSEAADYAIRVTRNAGGWQVQKADGATVTVDTAEAARRIREDLKQANTQAEAEALVAIVDQWHTKAGEGTERQTTLTGETVRSDGQTITATRDGEIVREITNAKVLETLRAEARMDAAASGSQEIDVLVNGQNSIEFGQRVADGAKQVIQRLELNQSHESTAFTAIHEQVEATWKTGVAKGTITREETQKAIASVASAFDPTTARDAEERTFRERVQRVASGQASETELRETMSELAVTEVIGRRKDGKTMPAGSVTAALDAAIGNATDAGTVKALGKFRAFLRAVRQYFRAVFGTVAALKKAKREGGGQEFDALVNKLLGIDEQAAHDEALADEVGEYVPPTEEEMAAGVAFRVSAGNRLELIQKRLDKALARDPKQRRELAKKAGDRLQKLQFDWETLRWTGKGDKIKPLIERRSKAELDKEQAVRQAVRAEELTTEGMATLSPEAIIAFEQGAERLDDRPLIATMLGDHGKLISKSTAARRGLYGEYDGAPWLPPSWYASPGRSGLMPDEMAQGLYESGLLREPSPDALWQALGREIESVRSANEAFANASKAVKDIEKQARDKAREEAYEWRREQDAQQERDWSPRARLVRDLRTLDAILSVMPPEVRGKVGGFVKLAALGSDEARVKEIGRRIEKLSVLLEKHLKKETTEAMQELLEKAEPKREAGKQSRGKLGAEAHRFFDQVVAVMEKTTEEVEGERAKIAALMADDKITTERAAELFEQEQILDAFGAWKEKSAADMDAALRAAQDVYTTGRNKWRTLEEARIAEVSAMAEQVVAALGGDSIAGIQKQQAVAAKVTTIIRNTALDLKSFGEVLEALLGRDHPLAQKWTRTAREGFARRNDEIRELRKRWREAMENATGQRGVKARRVLWDMGNTQTITVENAGKRKGSTEKVPVAVIDQWKAGTADPAALGVDPTEATQLIADRDAMEADDRRQSLPLSRSSRELSGPVKLSEAQGIFLTMLGAQEQYSEALDQAGWTADALKSIEDQLSPAAKQLREFMRNEYRYGYAPLAQIFERMYGVALPQIRNYAPAAFYHMGAEKAPMPGEGGGSASGMRAGFLANRKRHTAAPRLENAFTTFFGHVNQTAHWKGLAEFVREFSGVLGRPEVKQAIEARHGKKMLEVLNDWVRNIEGNGLQVQPGQIGEWISSLTGKQAYIALAFRLGTLAKQSSALLGAAYRIPLTAYARGFGKLMSGKLDVRAMFESPVIQRRLESGFAPEVRAALNDIWTAKPTQRAAILEKGMELIGLTDAIFTTGSAAIAYDYHLQKAKEAGLTAEAAHGAAMREVEDMVGRTAQPADVVDRSRFEALLNPMGRLLFMFASEARQKSSLWLTAWGNTLTGKATADDVRVLVLSHLVVAPMMQAITAAWRDMRDDDDDELFDEENWDPMDFLKAVVAGPLAGLPLIGDYVSGFSNNGIFSRFGFAFYSAKQLFDGPKEREAEQVEWYVKRITRIMQGLDAFTGVAGSVIDQGVSLVDNLATDEDEQAKKDRAAIRRERKEVREE